MTQEDIDARAVIRLVSNVLRLPPGDERDALQAKANQELDAWFAKYRP